MKAVRQFDRQGRKGVQTTREHISKVKENISRSGKPQPNSRKNKRRNRRLGRLGSLPHAGAGVRRRIRFPSRPRRSVRSAGPPRPWTAARKPLNKQTVDRGRKTIKQASSTAKGTIKTTSKSIKTAEKTAKASIKTTQQAAKGRPAHCPGHGAGCQGCGPCRPCSRPTPLRSCDQGCSQGHRRWR